MMTVSEATEEIKQIRELIANIEVLLTKFETDYIDSESEFANSWRIVNSCIPSTSHFDMHSMLKIYKHVLVIRDCEISEALSKVSIDLDSVIA